MNTIEINGRTYKERVIDSPKMSKTLNTIMLMAYGFGMPQIKHNRHPNINIVKEFELIQQKKSNLSKSKRDWVERQFHSNFEEI